MMRTRNIHNKRRTVVRYYFTCKFLSKQLASKCSEKIKKTESFGISPVRLMLLSHKFRKCFLLSDDIFLNVRSARLLERFVQPKAEQDGITIRLTRVTMNYRNDEYRRNNIYKCRYFSTTGFKKLSCNEIRLTILAIFNLKFKK